MTESVRNLLAREVVLLNPSRVKPVIYVIDTLSLPSLDLGVGESNDWSDQYQNNAAGWDIGSWCQQFGFPVD